MKGKNLLLQSHTCIIYQYFVWYTYTTLCIESTILSQVSEFKIAASTKNVIQKSQKNNKFAINPEIVKHN